MSALSGRSPRDANRVPVNFGVSSTDGITVEPFEVNPSTGRLLVDALISSGSATDNVNLIQVGGSSISLGQNTKANSLPITLASDQGNLPVNMTQINGVAASVGNGTTDTGTQRVTISSDSTAHVELWDGTNTANILKADGTVVAQNAQLIAGAGMTTATVSLSAGTQNTQWYDLLNYPWISVEILTNTTPATLTFQTSGDSSQTNVVSMPLQNSANLVSGAATSTTSATATFYGPRVGRYFRISSNLAGGNTATLVLTFYTTSSALAAMGVSAAQSGTWTVGSNSATGSAVPANAFYVAGINASGNLTGLATIDRLGDGSTGTAVLSGSPMLFNGTNYDRSRGANVFKTATATASGDTALWTPTTGKKFRLSGYMIQITADAALAAGADLDIVLRDSTTATAAAFSVFVPTVAGTTFGNTAGSGWVTFGNGMLSAAANNVLNINLSAALTSGKVRVVAMGTEE